MPVIGCGSCLKLEDEKNFFFAGVCRSKSVRTADDGIGPTTDEFFTLSLGGMVSAAQSVVAPARFVLTPRPPPTGHHAQHVRQVDFRRRSRRVVARQGQHHADAVEAHAPGSASDRFACLSRFAPCAAPSDVVAHMVPTFARAGIKTATVTSPKIFARSLSFAKPVSCRPYTARAFPSRRLRFSTPHNPPLVFTGRTAGCALPPPRTIRAPQFPHALLTSFPFLPLQLLLRQ